MRTSALIGFFGGIIIGLLQIWTMFRVLSIETMSTLDYFIHFSPQIIYFMCIYMSIKIYTRVQPNSIPEFKGCLKAGLITMSIICLFWWAANFVAFTHMDVRAAVNYEITHGQRSNIPTLLSNYSKQKMFDHAKFMTLPNFLLGFVVTVMVTVVFRLRRKA